MADDDFATRSERLRAMRAAGTAPLSYEIVIDEPQRAALLGVLSALPAVPEALEYWVGMLTSLPADEAENPGIVHGFCL